MTKKILIALSAIAITGATYAAMRCTFCKGTGFRPGTDFTCSFCNGRGSR